MQDSSIAQMVVLSCGDLLTGHGHCHCCFPACVSSALLSVVLPLRSVVIERTHIGPWPGPWLLGSHLCPFLSPASHVPSYPRLGSLPLSLPS